MEGREGRTEGGSEGRREGGRERERGREGGREEGGREGGTAIYILAISNMMMRGETITITSILRCVVMYCLTVGGYNTLCMMAIVDSVHMAWS